MMSESMPAVKNIWESRYRQQMRGRQRGLSDIPYTVTEENDWNETCSLCSKGAAIRRACAVVVKMKEDVGVGACCCEEEKRRREEILLWALAWTHL